MRLVAIEKTTKSLQIWSQGICIDVEYARLLIASLFYANYLSIYFCCHFFDSIRDEFTHVGRVSFPITVMSSTHISPYCAHALPRFINRKCVLFFLSLSKLNDSCYIGFKSKLHSSHYSMTNIHRKFYIHLWQIKDVSQQIERRKKNLDLSHLDLCCVGHIEC